MVSNKNIPYGQSSAKLPVTWSLDHLVTWSLGHSVTRSLGHYSDTTRTLLGHYSDTTRTLLDLDHLVTIFNMVTNGRTDERTDGRTTLELTGLLRRQIPGQPGPKA